MRNLTGFIFAALFACACAEDETIESEGAADATAGDCHECSCVCADGHVFEDEACWDDAPPEGLCRVARDPNQLNFELLCDDACAEHGGEADEIDGGPALDGATSDAALPPPDAALPPPDAALPPPDAALPPPDAALPPPDAAPCDESNFCARNDLHDGWHCDGDRRVRCGRSNGCTVEAESDPCGGDTPGCEPQSVTCVACIMHGDTRLCDQIPPHLIDVCDNRLPAPSWALTAPLVDVDLHWANHFNGPDDRPEGYDAIPYINISPADYVDIFPRYQPWGDGTRYSSGHNWIFVKQPDNDRWWGATFEGLSAEQQMHSLGNVNYSHENILAGTPLAAPWLPTPGDTYGFMLSTGAYTPRPGGNGEQRSNILLAELPAR